MTDIATKQKSPRIKCQGHDTQPFCSVKFCTIGCLAAINNTNNTTSYMNNGDIRSKTAKASFRFIYRGH